MDLSAVMAQTGKYYRPTPPSHFMFSKSLHPPARPFVLFFFNFFILWYSRPPPQSSSSLSLSLSLSLPLSLGLCVRLSVSMSQCLSRPVCLSNVYLSFQEVIKTQLRTDSLMTDFSLCYFVHYSHNHNYFRVRITV